MAEDVKNRETVDQRVRMLLDSGDWTAVHALISEGQGAALLPALEDALHGDCRFACIQASTALSQIGEAAVSVLIKAIASDSIRVCWSAAWALGEIGPAAAEQAIPALLQVIKSPNDQIGSAVATALSKFQPQAHEIASTLAGYLSHMDYEEHACWALVQLGPEAAPATPALVENLRHDSQFVVWRAAWVLSRIGPGARAAIPALVELLQSPAPGVAIMVIEAIGNTETDDPAAAAAVLPFLDEENDQIRGFALQAVETLQNPDIDVQRPFMKIMEEHAGQAGLRAAMALRRMGYRNKPLADALGSYMSGRDQSLVARSTAAVLSHVLESDPPDRNAVELLAQHATPPIRHAAEAWLKTVREGGDAGESRAAMVLLTNSVTASLCSIIDLQRGEYYNLCDSVPDCLLSIDRTGQIKVLNDAGLAQFGDFVATGDSRDRSDGSQSNRDVHRRIYADLLESFRTGKQTANREESFIHADGARVDVLTSVRPLRNAEGQIVWVLASTRDVTELRALEARQRELGKQLQVSEKLQAIGQLSGGIAHDFNNQLVPIMGYAEYLKKSLPEDDKRKEFANEILAAAERLESLTRQLLSFSRTGQHDMVAVDIHSIIEDICGILEHTIDKQVAVRRKLNAESSTILGESSQLHNMLLNLGLNSRDAMPDGGELMFTTELVELSQDGCRDAGDEAVTPGTFLKLCVSDTGVGMDEATMARVFEPFFTTKPIGQGTGMGLAAVYGTVSSHKGMIHVISRPAQGTTMTVHLPLMAAEPVPQRQPQEASLRPAMKAKVLLVDDEKHVLEVQSLMFDEAGVEVVAFQDGTEAVAYYRANWSSIDLLILDVVMPGLSGRQTFEALREVNPKIKAIVCSGYGPSEEVDLILADGALGFLPKPFRGTELMDLVRKYLA